MAVLGGISGSTGSQVSVMKDIAEGTTSSAKTNTAAKTDNTASSQNTSGGTGAVNAGTSATNSVSGGGNTTNITVTPEVTNKTNAVSSQEAAQRSAANAVI